MLKNKRFLVDEHCPMCAFYGKCFTKTGLIDSHTIEPYQHIDDSIANNIDMERAKSEIALHDLRTTKTIYGLDAIIEIIGQNKSQFKNMLRSSLLYPFLKICYGFISYNRKVMYPVAKKVDQRDCTPPLNINFRWAYILLVAILTGIILNQYAFYISAGLGMEHNWLREFYICFGQIVWQLAAIMIIDKSKIHEYLGNMSTVSLMGGMLLLPILLVNVHTTLSPVILIIAFLGVVSFMLAEHIRRCRILELSFWMTISWLAFRMFVLVIILFTMVFF